MGLEIAPDRLDVVEFGGVFRQPLDGEPVCAGGQGGERAFAGVDRTIVLNQHDRLGLSPGLRSKETVELLQMGDEIAAALGRAGMDDELARDVTERPQHRDLLGLPRRRHTQVRPRLRPGAGKIGMRQRLALIAVEKNNVARFGLLFAQLSGDEARRRALPEHRQGLQLDERCSRQAVEQFNIARDGLADAAAVAREAFEESFAEAKEVFEDAIDEPKDALDKARERMSEIERELELVVEQIRLPEPPEQLEAEIDIDRQAPIVRLDWSFERASTALKSHKAYEGDDDDELAP